MVWGELTAGLFGAGSSWLNQMMSYESNKKLQENQARLNYQYAEKSARNAPTWNRAGLESAGYNPMLAVQNATAGANSNWTGSAHADMADPMGGAVNATNVYQSAQRLSNETKTAESTAEMNTANARKANADSVAQELRNPYIPKNEQLQLNKMSAETQKLSRETAFFDALEDNMQNRLALEQYLGEMGINVQKYGYDTSYNATKYASDIQKGIADRHMPSSRSESFKNYMFGAGAGIGALGGIGSYALNLLPKRPFGFH